VDWWTNVDMKIPIKRATTILASNQMLSCIRFNKRGTLLAASGFDATVRIFDSKTGGQKGFLRGHSKTIMSVCFSNNGEYIMAAGNDNIARVWSMNTSHEVWTLTGHRDKILPSVFTPESDLAITGSYDRQVKIWDMSNGRCQTTLSVESAVPSFSLAPNGDTLATAHLDRSLRLWSIRTKEKITTLDNLHLEQLTSAEWSRDGNQVVTNSRDSTLKLIDVRTFKVLRQFKGDSKQPYVNTVNWGRACFSTEIGSKYVSAGSSNGDLFIWETSSGKLEKVLEGKKKVEFDNALCVTNIEWNPNGRQLASCTNGGVIHIWE